MSTTQNSDQQTQNLTKWQKLVRDWGYVRLGHEGMMLDKINRQNRIVEVLARNAATGDVSDVSGWPEGDDMGVNIGNEIHYHGGANAPTPTPLPPAQQAPSLATKALPWIVAGAAALGGAGLTSALIDRNPTIESPAAEPFEFPSYDVEKWVPE